MTADSYDLTESLIMNGRQRRTAVMTSPGETCCRIGGTMALSAFFTPQTPI